MVNKDFVMIRLNKKACRISIGSVLLALGFVIVAYSLWQWDQLPKAFLKIVEKETIVKLIPTPPPQDPHVGPSTVINRWNNGEKGYEDTPSGGYQFQDKNGVIQTLNFCDEPKPDFEPNSVVEVHFAYTPRFDAQGCVKLVWAKVISEAHRKGKQ